MKDTTYRRNYIPQTHTVPISTPKNLYQGTSPDLSGYISRTLPATPTRGELVLTGLTEAELDDTEIGLQDTVGRVERLTTTTSTKRMK